MVAICANYLVGSINSLVKTSGISRAFIGLILIPIIGNAAEHVTAVVVAVRDKMDLAMSVAVGSSIQISLLVTPFLVIVSWALGSDMSFHFETCRFRTTRSRARCLYVNLLPVSPNCCLFRLRSCRYAHRARRQIQLP